MDGKKWRERSKLITFVLKMLEPVGLDAALNGALPVALKTKPADRGKFAEKARAPKRFCSLLTRRSCVPEPTKPILYLYTENSAGKPYNNPKPSPHQPQTHPELTRNPLKPAFSKRKS